MWNISIAGNVLSAPLKGWPVLPTSPRQVDLVNMCATREDVYLLAKVLCDALGIPEVDNVDDNDINTEQCTCNKPEFAEHANDCPCYHD